MFIASTTNIHFFQQKSTLLQARHLPSEPKSPASKPDPTRAPGKPTPASAAPVPKVPASKPAPSAEVPPVDSKGAIQSSVQSGGFEVEEAGEEEEGSEGECSTAELMASKDQCA